MFETRDEFRLDLKAANKVGTIGVSGENCFNRYRAFEQRLVGTIDNTKTARTNFLVQFVTLQEPNSGGSQFLRPFIARFEQKLFRSVQVGKTTVIT